VEKLILIRVSKISSNDSSPLIYLPKEVRRALDLKKGDRVMLYVDPHSKRLVIEKVPALPPTEGA